jgi:hypothetical protein
MSNFPEKWILSGNWKAETSSIETTHTTSGIHQNPSSGGEVLACPPLRLFVAIDRTSKFAYAQLHETAGKMLMVQFLQDLIAAVPYAIHIVLTDNGIQFTNRTCDQHAPQPE